MSGPLQSMADPMSTYNLSLRHMQEWQKKRDEELREESLREEDLLNRPENKISNKPSKAYLELSKQLNQKHYKSKPRSVTTSDSSASSSLETSTSSNSSNYSFKEGIISNNTTTKTNTNKSCSIQ